MPPKKRKAPAPGTAAPPAAEPDTPDKKLPFAERMFVKKKSKQARAAPDAKGTTAIAIVGGDMHVTVFTTLAARTPAVRSIMNPGTNGHSAFIQKAIWGPVKIPGTDKNVERTNNYSNIYYVDPDVRAKLEDELDENCKTWKDYLSVFVNRYMSMFDDVQIFLDRVPLSHILPTNMFSRWFYQKKFDPSDILDNAEHGWVTDSGNSTEDAAKAKQYLDKGDEERAKHRARMELLESQPSSQETVDIDDDD